MESDGDKNLESNIKRKSSDSMLDGGNVLQPFRFRLGAVLADRDFRKFMEGQFRFVLYCGSLLWILYWIKA